jgi:hypothetical protein
MADLLGEIEHLRHMLRNANEEKTIQVEIVQDEVVEKQKIIEDMKRQRTEDQANINALQQQVASASSQAEELARLRVEVEELRNVKDAAPSTAPSAVLPPSVADRIAEVHSLCIRSCQALSVRLEPEQQQGLSAETVRDSTETALQRLLEVATSAEEAAKCRSDLVAADTSQTEEITRLRVEVEELRRAKDALPSPTPSVAADPSQAEELARLRVEVEELRRAKDALPSPTPSDLSPPSLADRIAEVHSISMRTCQVLSVCFEPEQQEALSAVIVRDAPEDALRRLGQVVICAEAAAQRLTTEKTNLASQLADAKVAANAAITAAAAAAAAAPVAQVAAPPPKPEEASPQVVSEAMNRQAAMALREVRLNAEQQLAWITRRIKMGRQSSSTTTTTKGDC